MLFSSLLAEYQKRICLADKGLGISGSSGFRAVIYPLGLGQWKHLSKSMRLQGHWSCHVRDIVNHSRVLAAVLGLA
jgi:hypothetical protein